jgi:hypothetical protein
MVNPVLSVDVDWVKNFNQFNLLFEFIVNRFKHSKQIIFIDCHHNILNFLEPNERSIINIDDHHDIHQPQVFEQDLNYIHIGNWVEYLISKNNLDHYFWLCNTTSHIEERHLTPIRQIKSFKILHNINDIMKFQYDKIVICKSFDYFRGEAKEKGLANIFNLLQIIAINLYKDKTIIDNQPNPYNFKLKNNI